MNAQMELLVLTPDKRVLETTANSLRVLLPDGWWGILPGHAPMISYLDSGIIHYRIDLDTRYIALYQGTIEVKQNLYAQTQILILTAAAEEGEDLTTVQANLAQQAQKLEALAKEADLEFKQIRLSLEKALQNAEITEF